MLPILEGVYNPLKEATSHRIRKYTYSSTNKTT